VLTFADDRRALRDRVLRLAVPSLLIVVAVGQTYLARTGGLSPWKGGGFGMFSTVDTPSARFLRAYLVRGSEQIPILVPRGLQPMAVEIRTFPRPRPLKSLAERLAAGTWVPYRFTPAMQRYLDASGDPDLSRLPDRDQTDVDDRRPVVSATGAPLLRMLSADEPQRVGPEAATFDGVRVELWQYTFDAPSARVRAARLLEVTADRPGRSP
jgi:hypothetical protein